MIESCLKGTIACSLSCTPKQGVRNNIKLFNNISIRDHAPVLCYVFFITFPYTRWETAAQRVNCLLILVADL